MVIITNFLCNRRPTALQDRTRDSDEDDYQDRDYDVAALANNLSQAFHYGIYSNDMEEVCYSTIQCIVFFFFFPNFNFFVFVFLSLFIFVDSCVMVKVVWSTVLVFLEIKESFSFLFIFYNALFSFRVSFRASPLDRILSRPIVEA